MSSSSSSSSNTLRTAAGLLFFVVGGATGLVVYETVHLPRNLLLVDASSAIANNILPAIDGGTLFTLAATLTVLLRGAVCKPAAAHSVYWATVLLFATAASYSLRYLESIAMAVSTLLWLATFSMGMVAGHFITIQGSITSSSSSLPEKQ